MSTTAISTANEQNEIQMGIGWKIERKIPYEMSKRKNSYFERIEGEIRMRNENQLREGKSKI